MDVSALGPIAASFSGITLLVGAIYIAYRNVKSQAMEKEQDRTLAAYKDRAAVVTDERNEARNERDLLKAERDHAIEQVETLRGLADNTPRLDRIIELLESQNERLRRIEENGRANS